MNWTQDTPKEVGWYWYKYEDDQRILKLELNHDQLMYRVFSFETRTEVYCYLPMKGWWYGPLEAPPEPESERQAEVSLSDLRPAEGNVGPNRGYLEGLGHGKVPTNMDAYGIEPQVNHYPDSLLPFDLARWQQPEGSQPGSFRASLYDPYGEELDD